MPVTASNFIVKPTIKFKTYSSPASGYNGSQASSYTQLQAPTITEAEQPKFMSPILDYNLDFKTVAYSKPAKLISIVEKKRQMSLSPTAKADLISYQTELKRRHNIRDYEIDIDSIKRQPTITGEESMLGTKIIEPPKFIEPSAKFEPSYYNPLTIKEIGTKHITAVAKELLKKRITDSSNLPKEYTKSFVGAPEKNKKRLFAKSWKSSGLVGLDPLSDTMMKSYRTVALDVDDNAIDYLHAVDDKLSKRDRDTMIKESIIDVERASSEIAVFPIRGISGAIGLASQIYAEPKETIKALPTMVKGLPSTIKRDAYLAYKFPLGFTADILVGYGLDTIMGDPVGRAIVKGTDEITTGITKLSPKFKTVVKNVFGQEEIKGITGVGGDNIDIVLVPGGRSLKRKLNVSDVVDAYGNLIPLTKNPKLPKAKNIKIKNILDAVKGTDDVVGGSYSQLALLEKEFVRGYDDLDIGSLDIDATVKRIENKVGKKNIKVVKQLNTTGIIDAKTGKKLADIVDYQIAEAGYLKKYAPIEIDGIKLADPRSRLAGKAEALSKGLYLEKTVGDIESLIGGAEDLSPLVSGRSGFGFSFEEQLEYAGKTGTIVSGQRSFFKKGLFGSELLAGTETYGFKPSKIPLESSFFGSPFDIATGKPLARITRLGVSESDNFASIFDVLSGKAEIGKSQQPQILIFENQKIANIPKKLSKLAKKAEAGDMLARAEFFREYINYQLQPSSQFKPLGFPGGELELTAYKSTVVKKAKIGVTVYKDKSIPIYSVELKKSGKALGGAVDIKKVIDDFIKGDITTKQVDDLVLDLKSAGADTSTIKRLKALVKKAKSNTNTIIDEVELFNMLNRDYSTLKAKKLYRVERLIKPQQIISKIKVGVDNSAESYITSRMKKTKSAIPLIRNVLSGGVVADKSLSMIRKGVKRTSVNMYDFSKAVRNDINRIRVPLKTSKSPMPIKKRYQPFPVSPTRSPLPTTKRIRLPIYPVSSIDPIIYPPYSPPPYKPTSGTYTPGSPIKPILTMLPPPARTGRLSPSKLVSRKPKKAEQIYGVEVRKSGEWIRADIPSQKHNKYSAMQLGINETSKSPARSFRLIKLSGVANIIRKKPPKQLTRYYKKTGKGNRKLKNAYIEKPKFAIDSLQERKTITEVGWQTNRNLKKQRQKQNGMLSRLLGNTKKIRS